MTHESPCLQVSGTPWLLHCNAQEKGIALDNEVQDLLHELLDAQRRAKGRTLDEYLEGQK